ncbi:MAG TPA: hypothetical protein P5056_00250 [Candidatus Paceibacterota bacterium]|nr:hypothetical protein [Candidatus Paceibacterota bacterium]
MGKRSKEKRKKQRRKDEIEESCTIPIEKKPPEAFRFNHMEFATADEAATAKFIFRNNIEKDEQELRKLVALIIKHNILRNNETEIRFARLLMKHNIRFEYSKEIETQKIIQKEEYSETPETTAKDGETPSKPGVRQIDFWLPDGPIMVPFCHEPVQSFEVKGGKLTMNCWRQRRELRDANYFTFIVLPQYISFWEKHGLLEPVSTRENNARGIYQKPACLMANHIPKKESSLKKKMVSVLRTEHIKFEYAEDVRGERLGDGAHRAIFFLKEPVKGFWCGEMTQAIMLIEGDITMNDFERWQEVSETQNTFLAVKQFVRFWHGVGFLRQKAK